MITSYLRALWGWKGFAASTFVVIMVVSSVACESNADAFSTENEFSMSGSEPVPVALSWESAKEPGRRAWSEFLAKLIDQRFETLDRVRDMETFCPRYSRLPRALKVNVWAMLIADVAYYESGWDPTNRFLERDMGRDPVTGRRVYSEGLLQLSYQDSVYYSEDCGFNWHKDKSLPTRDPRKTILDPYINLHCGVAILTHQIANRRDIVLNSGAYWSTLRTYRSKVRQIAASMKHKLSFCQ